MWLWAGVVLLAAVFGKMGGAALAARWTGQSWRDAIALGALLNTRGLVELVVLNIAYTVDAFTPTLFTMLVVMALVTTMLTAPILTLLGIRGTARKQPGSVPVSVADSGVLSEEFLFQFFIDVQIGGRVLWYPTQAKTGLEWDTTALDRAGGGWSCRKRIYRSFASTRSKVKPEGRRRRSCRSRSSAASRLRSRVISNSRGPAILTSIWSPSFNSSASTTAAGRRTAKLFPHLDTCTGPPSSS